MKLEYVISFGDFRSVQAPFTVKAGRNVGFWAALVVCAAMALLGIVCMFQGLGVALGFFLIGLGTLAACAAYYFDSRSVKAAKQKYEDGIERVFQQIHCRDRRVIEIDEAGFTIHCACGTVSRPWSELISFSENQPFVVIRTKSDLVPVPKSAFRSEGDLTEFRALALGKLNQAKPFAVRPIDFRYQPADFRNGAFLNALQAGGWRRWLRSAVTLAGFGYLMSLVLQSQSPSRRDAPAAFYFAFGTVLLFALVRRLIKKKNHYNGPLRLAFGPEGLHIQDPQTVAVVGWDRFLGYLEDRNVFLIYSGPKLYRIVPKRILGDREKEFASLLEAKLPIYNYKRPALPVQAAVTSAPN
jgi:hypothetical protein